MAQTTQYGGTAKTYTEWEHLGNPFEEDKKQYIIAIHPKTGKEKKVRWYADAAHQELMGKQTLTQTPSFKIFGFESEDSAVIAIPKSAISVEETDQYFAYKWRGCRYFGDIWYAPIGTELPRIKHMDAYFYPTWQEWKKQKEVA